MPTLYEGETRRAYASLQQVSDDTEIDVFVSHKKEDASQGQGSCRMHRHLRPDGLARRTRPSRPSRRRQPHRDYPRAPRPLPQHHRRHQPDHERVLVGPVRDWHRLREGEAARHLLRGTPAYLLAGVPRRMAAGMQSRRPPRMVRSDRCRQASPPAPRIGLGGHPTTRVQAGTGGHQGSPETAQAVVATASLRPTHCRSSRGSLHMRARRRRDTLRPVCYGTHAGTPLTPRAPRLLSRSLRIQTPTRSDPMPKSLSPDLPFSTDPPASGAVREVRVSPSRTLKATPVFDTYWRFAAERQRLFLRRVRGSPPPWTDDPVLLRHRFTNVYRASDRVSQYLIRHVLYAGEQTPREIFFRAILFKFFNRIDTWDALVSPFRLADGSYLPARPIRRRPGRLARQPRKGVFRRLHHAQPKARSP